MVVVGACAAAATAVSFVCEQATAAAACFRLRVIILMMAGLMATARRLLVGRVHAAVFIRVSTRLVDLAIPLVLTI